MQRTRTTEIDAAAIVVAFECDGGDWVESWLGWLTLSVGTADAVVVVVGNVIVTVRREIEVPTFESVVNVDNSGVETSEEKCVEGRGLVLDALEDADVGN